jgi:hypothetical protein
MSKLTVRSGVGLILIATGVLYLLQSLDVIQGGFALLWILLFALSGVVFMTVFFSNREHWWAVIPGFTMLGLAGTIAVGKFAPGNLGFLAGAILLGMIALSFWLIAFQRREFWWAIIPAGVLTTLTGIVAFERVMGNGDAVAGFLFFGLALTFAAIGLLPGSDRNLRWAFIPAGILGVMGVILFSAAYSLFEYILPVLLILGGVFLMFRSMIKKQKV